MTAPNAPRTSLLAVAGALILLALLAPTTLAQVPQPQVTVLLEKADLSLGANETIIMNGTVRYTDQVSTATGAITLTVTAPDGWTLVVDPATTFTLTAGQEAPITLTLTAPGPGLGALTAEGSVTATVTAGAGRATGTSTATVALTRVDPPPPPPTDYTPLIVGLAAAFLVAVAATVLVLRRRKLAREAAAKEAAERVAAQRAAYVARETGISIAIAEGPALFGDRREVVYRLSIKNTSERTRVAVIDIKEATPGWLAAVSVPRRELEAGETMVVSATVRPPATASEDARANITISARPAEAEELDERVTLDVHAPIPVPSKDKVKPFVAARDGVVPKVFRY